MKTLALVTSVALSCVAAGSPLAAQGGKGPITLTVRAVTDTGDPVLDLKPADLAVKINGKAREVKSLKLVQVGAGAARSAAAQAPPVSLAPPPFSTNATVASAAVSGEPSRLILIAIDDESFGAGDSTYAKNAASQIVASLSPSDRVSVLTVPHGSSGLPPTPDRAAIGAAIAAVSGRENSSETDAQIGCRTVVELQALKGVLQTVPTDEPATVVFISGGIAAPSTGSSQRTGSSRNSSMQITSDSECVATTSDYQTFQTAARASSANLYIVHLPDVISSKAASTVTLLTSGAEYMASASGGTLIRFTGGSETALARVAKETGSYYVASFDSDPADKTPTGRLEIRSIRDKVRVRAPSEVSLSAKADAGAASGGKAPSPKDMVRDLKAFRDLSLRATTIAQRNTGDDRIKVIVLFEPDAPSTGSGQAGTITSATVGMVDDKGKLTAQWTAQDAELKSQPLLGVLAVPAGTYRVRVAAADSSGKAGAVDDAFTAGLTAAGPSLKLSGLTLFAQTGTGIAPRLQFKDEPEAIVLFELYGRPAGRLQARLEVAKTTDGAAIGAPVQPGASGTAEPDKFTLSAKIPIADLAPGDYVIRAIVNEEGQPEGKVTRTLRKLPK